MRRLLLALVVIGTCALSGCGVGMPTTGEIHHAGPPQRTAAAPGIAIDPRPPQAGASAPQVVQGFLDAMLATPTQTRTARQFLTRDASAAWNPAAETISYSAKSPASGTGSVSVDLQSATRFDARGAWQGALTPAEEHLTFPMVKQKGQWRISAAPDALIVPQSWFQSRYSQENLYWFDETGRVLVPEPVFVPRGTQMATTLVRDIVQGPGRELLGTARTFLPPDVGGGLSVPVSPDGVAQVALTGGAEPPATPQALTLMRAQLSWTLRQDPSVHTIRMSIGGHDVQMSDGTTQFSVSEGGAYDPSGYQTNPRVFALEKGELVSGEQPGSLRPVEGPFGATPHALDSFAVDLWAASVAAVTAGRHELLVGPVHDEHPLETAVTHAADLLRPAWDAQGRVWLVDARPSGAEVSYLAPSGQRHTVDIPGITGTDVRRFLVSRDGARLVAVVHRPTGDEVVVSLLRSDDTGAVTGATAAMAISPLVDSSTSIQDIGWASPTEVFLLHRLSTSSQIRTVVVDGSSDALPATPITVGEAVDSLITAPTEDAPQYARSGQRLVGLTTTALDVDLSGTLDDLTYVG